MRYIVVTAGLTTASQEGPRASCDRVEFVGNGVWLYEGIDQNQKAIQWLPSWRILRIEVDHAEQPST